MADDGQRTELVGSNVSFSIDRVAPAVVVVVIWGRDVGEHGDRPLRALDGLLAEGSARGDPPVAGSISAPSSRRRSAASCR